MKKIMLFVVFILISLFIITGCGKTTNNSSNESNKEMSISKIKINNVDVELDRTSTFNGINYSYPSKATSSNIGTYAIIDLMDNDDLLVRVALSFYSGKTIEQVMAGSTLNNTDSVKYNNITWDLYEGVQDDGKNILNYITTSNGDSYSVAFVSDKDVSDFVKEFLNNVAYK